MRIVSVSGLSMESQFAVEIVPPKKTKYKDMYLMVNLFDTINS